MGPEPAGYPAAAGADRLTQTLTPPPRSASEPGLHPGRVVDRWVLEERLGEGGFGEVWRARRRERDADAPPGTPDVVALKFAHDPRRVSTLAREAGLLRGVAHPALVRVHEVAAHAERPYLVLEHVAGRDLASVIDARAGLRFRWQATLPIIDDVAAGLSAAHEAGVVHGDIKPANILIARDGGALLTDFGLGWHADGASDAEVDRSLARSFAASLSPEATAAIRGTLAYMAPECRRGERARPASDVYSLGLVLYQMLTGGLPRGAWRPLAQQGVVVPARLEGLLRRMLDPIPGCRPADAGELRAALAVAARVPADDPAMARDGARLARELARRCPVDGAPLHPVTIHGAVLDRCRRCGGTWFDTGELAIVVEAMAEEQYLIPRPELEEREPALACPTCRQPLRRGELRILAGSEASFVEVGTVHGCPEDGTWVPSATRMRLIRAVARLAAGELPAVRRESRHARWWSSPEGRAARRRELAIASRVLPGLFAEVTSDGALRIGSTRDPSGCGPLVIALLAFYVIDVVTLPALLANAGESSPVLVAGMTVLGLIAPAIVFVLILRFIVYLLTPWYAWGDRIVIGGDDRIWSDITTRPLRDLASVTVGLVGYGPAVAIRFDLEWRSGGRASFQTDRVLTIRSAHAHRRAALDVAHAVASLGGPHVHVGETISDDGQDAS